jgi:biofilm PGA synthesis N-glycosyltransferase PgaC
MIRTYAVVTPARDEADNLPRLADCLARQTVLPLAWHIVDNGSTDGTDRIAQDIAAQHPWIRLLSIPGASSAERGAPAVRALLAGIAALNEPPDLVINVDADISFPPDYFERLLAKFASDPSLGIASGGLLEFERGGWRRRHLTGSTVVGASRAYRWQCLQEIMPLEQRVAWDGLDEFQANAGGWRTQAFEDICVHHHRREGARDGTNWAARRNQGHAAYYIGYRPWYLVLRAVWHARREPAALAMISGYASAALRRDPRFADKRARAYLRGQQSLRNQRLRAGEALSLLHKTQPTRPREISDGVLGF